MVVIDNFSLNFTGAFHFFAFRDDSPLGVRGKECENRENEIH